MPFEFDRINFLHRFLTLWIWPLERCRKIPHLGKNPSELCRIIFMIWIKDLLRKETSTKVIKRGTTDQRFYVFPLKNIRSWKVPKHKFCLLPVGQHELVVVLVLGIITSLLDIWPHIQYFSLLKTFLKFLKFNTNSKTQKKFKKLSKLCIFSKLSKVFIFSIYLSLLVILLFLILDFLPNLFSVLCFKFVIHSPGLLIVWKAFVKPY